MKDDSKDDSSYITPEEAEVIYRKAEDFFNENQESEMAFSLSFTRGRNIGHITNYSDKFFIVRVLGATAQKITEEILRERNN